MPPPSPPPARCTPRQIPPGPPPSHFPPVFHFPNQGKPIPPSFTRRVSGNAPDLGWRDRPCNPLIPPMSPEQYIMYHYCYNQLLLGLQYRFAYQSCIARPPWAPQNFSMENILATSGSSPEGSFIPRFSQQEDQRDSDLSLGAESAGPPENPPAMAEPPPGVKAAGERCDKWVWVGPGCVTKGRRGRAKQKIYSKVRKDAKVYQVGSYVKLHKSSSKNINYAYCQIKNLFETVLKSKKMKIQLLRTSTDPTRMNHLVRDSKVCEKCFPVSDIVDTIDVLGFADFMRVQSSGDIVKRMRTFYIEE